jgi:hypothetical protein
MPAMMQPGVTVFGCQFPYCAPTEHCSWNHTRLDSSGSILFGSLHRQDALAGCILLKPTSSMTPASG